MGLTGTAVIGVSFGNDRGIMDGSTARTKLTVESLTVETSAGKFADVINWGWATGATKAWVRRGSRSRVVNSDGGSLGVSSSTEC